MHLSNISQILQRNDDLLLAHQPLLVNMPDDDLALLITQLNPKCQLSFYDTNFALHLAHQKIAGSHCDFSAHYQSKIVYDLVIIAFPKSKQELLFTLAMLAHCITEHSKILFVGENKSGIKSISKIIASLCHYCDKVDAARHCILFQASLKDNQPAFDLEQWYNFYQVNLANKSFNVAALPGVFSQKGLDTGSKILLENLPTSIQGKVLDFGCGAGVIATFIGLQNDKVTLTLADVSALALASSLKTLEINKLKGTIIATDSLSHIQDSYQFVISNPPFHQGIKTHYAATEQFLAHIKKQINNKGSLLIVANSFLKYQPIIAHAFGQVETLSVKQGFAIYQAKC